MNGFIGKMLFVDLTTGETEVRELTEELVKAYPGGAALGAKILYEEMAPNTDVFAPESMFGFVCGALNGTGALMSCRYTVVSKSPVTNGWNDANAGGGFGPMLRQSGFDAVFVKGIAPKPVYILIDDGKVEIRDASAYWGKTTTLEFERAIAPEIGKKFSAASISVAGEQKHHLAAVMNDGHRAAARGGPGAVMGSKNLKALVVCGTHKVSVANKEALLGVNKTVVDWQKNGPVKDVVSAFYEWGTGAAYESSIYTGDAGMKNWLGCDEDCSEDVKVNPSAQAMDVRFKKKKYACFNCSVGCGAIYDLTREGYDQDDAGRPEYETTGSFGCLLLNGDSLCINKCNTLCNEYGLDTISVGGTIAWAMECYEKGILTKEDLDGIELTWGNSDAILAITEKMAKSEGCGAILANGSAYAAKVFGKGEECLVLAGGIEFPQHDSRYGPSLARTYKFDPTPGRHVKGGTGATVGARPAEYKHNPDAFLEDDVRGTYETELRSACGYCIFTDFGFAPDVMRAYWNASTGYDYSTEEFLQTGRRSFLIRQAFNQREGFRREDATMSGRMLGIPPLEKGPLAGVTMDVEKMGDNFFRALGCDMHGVPTRETLEELGMFEVMKDLYPEA